MADSNSSDGTASTQRRQLYTNVLRALPGLDDLDFPLLHLTMDTWYYAEWADHHHTASLGTLALGDGPLTAAQGAAAFIARQVALFLDAFSGIFLPTAVRVGYRPHLTGVVYHAFDFPVPETPEEVQAIQTSLEQSAYDGIVNLTIDFDLWATVRDEDGQFTQLWLPDAGTARYRAHYTDGYSADPPRYGAVTYLLTPEAQAGRAPWAVDLECNFISLFRATNADVLARVRGQWQQWLQTHPLNMELSDEGDGAEDASEQDDEVVTLAVPPHGTPPDNRDLYDRNTPRLRAAVARWEQRLGTPFEWAVTL
jgi:hypothetical protein